MGLQSHMPLTKRSTTQHSKRHAIGISEYINCPHLVQTRYSIVTKYSFMADDDLYSTFTSAIHKISLYHSMQINQRVTYNVCTWIIQENRISSHLKFYSSIHTVMDKDTERMLFHVYVLNFKLSSGNVDR